MSVSSLQQNELFSLTSSTVGTSTEINMRNKLLSGQPEYQNLCNDRNTNESENCPITMDRTKMKSKSIHIPVTPDLPPRPVLQPKNSVKSNIQNGQDLTKGLMNTPIKSCSRNRCISPSPSIISSSSISSQNSHSLQRCKYTPKSTAHTLRRPHVLHRKCSLNMSQLEKLFAA